jgi:hypothetical protein
MHQGVALRDGSVCACIHCMMAQAFGGGEIVCLTSLGYKPLISLGS